MSTITQAIKSRIDARGADPADVAAAAGMTAAQLRQTLAGGRKLKASELVGICQFLELDLSDLK